MQLIRKHMGSQNAHCSTATEELPAKKASRGVAMKIYHFPYAAKMEMANELH